MTDLEIARAALQTVIDKTTPMMVIHQVCAKALEDTKPKNCIRTPRMRRFNLDVWTFALGLCNGNIVEAFELLENLR